MSLVSAPITRRSLLAAAAAAGGIRTVSASPALARTVGSSSSADSAVRPFRVSIPGAEVADLRRRIAATRWPERETVSDRTQGVPLATLQKLVRYWGTEYEWRKTEAKLNAFPQFLTQIDGLDLHFIHVRSKHPNALPLIITHGWPGSVIEQLKVIGPLTDPTAHGGKAEDAFDVVIPSLPGYGFSAKPTTTGWNPPRIARAWFTLMKRLGYSRFVAQGGDWGNAITELMALQGRPELLGISTNMAATVPPDVSRALSAGGAPPSGLSDDERRSWKQLDFFYKKGLGYANEMGLRPQTLYGLVDSPAGLAAWMCDHDAPNLELLIRVFDGKPEGLSREDVVENISLYWFTNTAISSARLYWETTQLAAGGFFDARGVKIPVAVSAFPDDIYTPPQSWSERAYPKLLRYDRHEKGGHFAAWEQPKALSHDLREAFRSLR